METAAQADGPANEGVLLRRDEAGIATLTLNRPDKFNALSVALLAALQRELDALASDRSVRVVVIEGGGKAFCAGHDLKEMRENPGAEQVRSLFDQCAKVMLSVTRIPQPVIARVHGIATAAGCQLVATCDLAIASERARFAVSGVNLGLFCSTPMVALSRVMGRKRAMEMLVTGEFIDAEIARDWGLVNRVVAHERLDEAVAELAGDRRGEIAGGGRHRQDAVLPPARAGDRGGLCRRQRGDDLQHADRGRRGRHRRLRGEAAAAQMDGPVEQFAIAPMNRKYNDVIASREAAWRSGTALLHCFVGFASSQ